MKYKHVIYIKYLIEKPENIFGGMDKTVIRSTKYRNILSIEYHSRILLHSITELQYINTPWIVNTWI